MTLTTEVLRQALEYNPATGTFTRRMNATKARIGDIAGSVNGHGYVLIGLAGVKYPAHRLAWLYVHGVLPHGEDIDHINGARDDNRIENLRCATRAQNCWNGKVRVNNTSGRKGVTWHKERKKWAAQISKAGKNYHLGLFETAEEAYIAYCNAAPAIHGKFARTE